MRVVPELKTLLQNSSFTAHQHAQTNLKSVKGNTSHTSQPLHSHARDNKFKLTVSCQVTERARPPHGVHTEAGPSGDERRESSYREVSYPSRRSRNGAADLRRIGAGADLDGLSTMLLTCSQPTLTPYVGTRNTRIAGARCPRAS